MEETHDWYSPEASTFGDRVAGARDQAGMTQQQLAKRLGIRLATLRAWENDLSEPRANRPFHDGRTIECVNDVVD